MRRCISKTLCNQQLCTVPDNMNEKIVKEHRFNLRPVLAVFFDDWGACVIPVQVDLLLNARGG